MLDQQPALVHQPARTCTLCGNDAQNRLRVDRTRPSLDDRYALGYCDDCRPARKGVRGVTRELVPLIRSDLFDRQAHQARIDGEGDRKLLARYRRGHLLTEDELAAVQVILDRLGRGR